MQRECRETAVICCWERKDKWKNGEIVLAPFGNFLRKLNPGEDSLERVVIRRQKSGGGGGGGGSEMRHGFFCSLLRALFCIFMKSL